MRPKVRRWMPECQRARISFPSTDSLFKVWIALCTRVSPAFFTAVRRPTVSASFDVHAFEPRTAFPPMIDRWPIDQWRRFRSSCCASWLELAGTLYALVAERFANWTRLFLRWYMARKWGNWKETEIYWVFRDEWGWYKYGQFEVNTNWGSLFKLYSYFGVRIKIKLKHTVFYKI